MLSSSQNSLLVVGVVSGLYHVQWNVNGDCNGGGSYKRKQHGINRSIGDPRAFLPRLK